MLWTVLVILVVLWLLRFIGHFGGRSHPLLLVIAVVILIINMIQGRRGLSSTVSRDQRRKSGTRDKGRR